MAKNSTTVAWDESGSMPMLLSETTGTTTTRYIYGPSGVLARVDANGTLYYHHDQLGSIRAITDGDGDVVGTATYDPYGTRTHHSGITTPFGFAGEYTDTETGFQYLRARYYDPTTATFLTRDPLEAITEEPYGYVGGNPLNYVDPLGQAAIVAPLVVRGGVAAGGEVAFQAIGNLIRGCGLFDNLNGTSIAMAAGTGPLGKPGSLGRLGRRGSSGARAIVDASKYDYLFGNVASNAHNAARSAQNAQQLARIGIHNNAAGRSLLQGHFDDVVGSSNNILHSYTNSYGTFQVRESLLAGPGGFLKLESTWQVTGDSLRLTTVIPIGG